MLDSVFISTILMNIMNNLMVSVVLCVRFGAALKSVIAQKTQNRGLKETGGGFSPTKKQERCTFKCLWQWFLDFEDYVDF